MHSYNSGVEFILLLYLNPFHSPKIIACKWLFGFNFLQCEFGGRHLLDNTSFYETHLAQCDLKTKPTTT